MVVSGYWRGLAIIFMVLFVLESISFVWLYSVGMGIMNDEIECLNDCSIEGGFVYGYDGVTGLCSCFGEDDVLIKRWVIV